MVWSDLGPLRCAGLRTPQNCATVVNFSLPGVQPGENSTLLIIPASEQFNLTEHSNIRTVQAFEQVNISSSSTFEHVNISSNSTVRTVRLYWISTVTDTISRRTDPYMHRLINFRLEGDLRPLRSAVFRRAQNRQLSSNTAPGGSKRAFRRPMD